MFFPFVTAVMSDFPYSWLHSSRLLRAFRVHLTSRPQRSSRLQCPSRLERSTTPPSFTTPPRPTTVPSLRWKALMLRSATVARVLCSPMCTRNFFSISTEKNRELLCFKHEAPCVLSSFCAPTTLLQARGTLCLILLLCSNLEAKPTKSRFRRYKKLLSIGNQRLPYAIDTPKKKGFRSACFLVFSSAY